MQRSVLFQYYCRSAFKHRRADRVVLPLERFRALCLKQRPESNLKSLDRWEKNNNKIEKNKDQSCRVVVGLRTDHKWNRRSQIETCQMMKSAIPGCWQENDQLEGEEPSSLCPTANHTVKREGTVRL